MMNKGNFNRSDEKERAERGIGKEGGGDKRKVVSR